MPVPAPSAVARRVAAMPGLVVLAVLAVVYRCTLLPGVGFSGDTAKLQLIGRVLGTPHNTGYPTYVALNAVFVRMVPIGSLAHRANLLSAACAAAACAVLALTLRRLALHPVVVVVAPLVLGLSYTFWSQAVAAEVYALHLLCTAAVLHLLVRWGQTGDRRLLLGAAAVAALALGNHLMVVLLVPGIAWFVLGTDRSVLRRPALLGAVAALVVAGLAQYGFVVWRSHNPDPHTYVQSEARNLSELVDVLRGAEFEDEMFQFSAGEVLRERVPLIWRYVRRDLSWVLAAAAVGLLAARRRAPLVGLLVLWAAADVAFALQHGVIDVSVFLLPAEFAVVVLAALGVDEILGRLRPLGRWRAVPLAALAVVPLVFAGWSWSVVERSKNLADAARARAAVAAAPDGAVIVSSEYEMSMFVLYDLLGEGVQPERDVRLVDRPDPAAVARYLRGDGPLEVSGGDVRPGRPVVAVDRDTAEAVAPAGVRTVAAADGTLRLVSDSRRAPRRQPPAARRRGRAPPRCRAGRTASGTAR